MAAKVQVSTEALERIHEALVNYASDMADAALQAEQAANNGELYCDNLLREVTQVIRDLDERIETLRKQIEALTTNIDRLEKERHQASLDLARAKSNINYLNQRIDELYALRSQLDTVDDSGASQNRVAQIDAEIATCRHRLSSEEADRASANSRITQAESSLRALQTELSSNQNQEAELSARKAKYKDKRNRLTEACQTYRYDLTAYAGAARSFAGQASADGERLSESVQLCIDLVNQYISLGI